MTTTNNALKLIIILLLLLLSHQFLTSRHQVYVYNDEDTARGGSQTADINAKPDDTIPVSVEKIVNSDSTQSHVESHDDYGNVPVNTKSNVDSTNKVTHSDNPHVITTITPPSQVLFPYPKITRQPQEILNSPWATKMKAKLEAANVGKQLTYVTVSMNYISVLINWLIHAKLNALPLMENLLVVCMDKLSCEVLSRKGVLSNKVKINEIIYSIKDMEGSAIFSARVITRLTVLRLLNYWGYDVLVMDIDALLINNIQPIFDHFSDSDIIVSTANASNCLPSFARKAWGFCLCIGLTLIRSNTNTGKFDTLL